MRKKVQLKTLKIGQAQQRPASYGALSQLGSKLDFDAINTIKKMG